jgi:arabinofuranan 3-O-arabinosyltransferase
VGARLFLYGLRDLDGQRQSRVEYQSVRLRPVASPSAIVLVRQDEGTAPAAARWIKHDPTRFSGTVTGTGPTTVALAENAAPGWRLTGVDGAEPVTVQGWMAGWSLPRGGQLTLRYTPARVARYALYLLPVTVLGAVIFLYATRLPAGCPATWSARHRRRPFAK